MLCNIQFSILRIGFLWSTPRILRQLAYHHIIYYYQIQLCYKDFKNYFIYKCLNIISRTIRRSLVYAQWIKIWPSHFSSEKKNYWDTLIPFLCTFLSLSLYLENFLWGLKVHGVLCGRWCNSSFIQKIFIAMHCVQFWGDNGVQKADTDNIVPRIPQEQRHPTIASFS